MNQWLMYLIPRLLVFIFYKIYSFILLFIHETSIKLGAKLSPLNPRVASEEINSTSSSALSNCVIFQVTLYNLFFFTFKSLFVFQKERNSIAMETGHYRGAKVDLFRFSPGENDASWGNVASAFTSKTL